MKILDAVENILQEAKQPVHYRDINKLIIQRQLFAPQGKTPERTVYSRIITEIKNHGEESVFVRTGEGTFALREWNFPPENFNKVKQAIAPRINNPLGKYLTFNDATEYVLQNYANQQPMHYSTITRLALENNLVQTIGLTPEATLYSQVLNEIKRQTNRGENTRFVKHGEGFIGLKAWLGEGVSLQIKNHNNEVRKKLNGKLLSISPTEFEETIGLLLTSIGFEEVSITPPANDGGIDVRGTLVVGDVIKTRMAIQVKRWQHNVQAPVVQQVRGSLGTHEHGLIITTSNFSNGAIAEAKRENAIPVALMNGEQLITLLIENEIGVHRISYDLLDLSEQ